MKKALALVLPASVLGVVLGVLSVSRVPWLAVGYGVFVPSVAVAVVLLVTAIAALLLGALRWLWPLCIGLVAQLLGLLLLYKEWWGFSTPWKPVWWTLAAIGAVLLVMGAIWLVVTVRTRWFERKMLQGVGDAGAEELEAIRKNFQDALGKLRRAGHGRNAIYELPWFLVIGRPQGGKTTAIKNSGLGLPVRKDWVKGVGGTVNVDFFFTNDLIFMDTPGRWVTDGANEREQRQWTELLRLLRRFPPMTS
jgi:type VI secretion system protein ImpL